MNSFKLGTETLKQIEGYYPYFISDTGNVYAEKKYIKQGSITSIQYRPVKTTLNASGYHYANLYAEAGGRSSLRVHRLVWQYHNPIKDCLKEGFIIDHIDEDKTNNDIANLQQITQKQNIIKYHKLKKKK